MIDEKYASDMHECHSIDSHNEVAFIQKSYFLATKDLVAAILLTQIYYWFSVSRHTKKVRASIERNGRLWIAKKREDWLDECCISPKQFDRGIKILEDKGFVVCSIFRFGADAVKHISLNYDRIAEIKRNSPSGNSRIPHQDKTTRTETTTDITPIPPKGGESENQKIPFSEMLEMWNSLEKAAKVRELSDPRKRAIRARWNSSKVFREEWREVMASTMRSKFLRGEVPPRDGFKQFKLTIDWFLNAANFSKISDGQYEDEAPVSRPSAYPSANPDLAPPPDWVHHMLVHVKESGWVPSVIEKIENGGLTWRDFERDDQEACVKIYKSTTK